MKTFSIADRRTKIVCTIGPASSSPEMLEKLLLAGLNVARLNFSHGTHEDHFKVLTTLRELSRKHHAPITILQDLQGPKIRIGKVKNGSIELKDGQKIVVRVGDEVGDENLLFTDFKSLPTDVTAGNSILLDDGNLEFRVDAVKNGDVHATVIFGGELKNNKGMNLPGAKLTVDCLTEKDLRDLEFGLKNNVDYVALSFVRRPEDIKRLREIVNSKSKHTRIMAKIEKMEALDNIEEIVLNCDAIMVARGDLAVEAGQSHLPGMQKNIIRLCNLLGRPVITATQMLDSMINHPRPTRAEVTDIANSVLDGTDAVMLSAETASGKFPVKCVETMDEIIREVERTSVRYYQMRFQDEFLSVADSIAESACLSAMKLNASAIICLTTSGKTATMISRARPKARIIAVSHLDETLNRLELVWGIQSFNVPPYNDSDKVMHDLEEKLLGLGLCKQGDRVILTMGVPVMERGTTNSIRVYTIKDNTPLAANDKLPLRYKK